MSVIHRARHLRPDAPLPISLVGSDRVDSATGYRLREVMPPARIANGRSRANLAGLRERSAGLDRAVDALRELVLEPRPRRSHCVDLGACINGRYR